MVSHAKDTVSRKCKILCTMGPACWDVDKLVQLFDMGCNICRLNFSHGDHEAHGACVARIKEAMKLRPNKTIGIALDTKGPEIRTGFFADPSGKIKLSAGQDLKLVIDYSFKGDNTCFAVTYANLPNAVKPGNTILIADGSLVLKVKSCAADHVITEVMNSCTIGERKNCNLPGIKVDLPVLQEKDINDLVNFGVPQGVNYVFASFVQSAADVKMIRDTLGEGGKDIKIIPKIENQEGLINFDEIVEAADGIMVARGDLGMEIPPQTVFLAQKIMIAKCNLMGKPVICATQMLESMCKAPRPTRAEAGDVANAVLDGADCVMLSGETAGGDFPMEAVTIMRRIVEEAEVNLDYASLYQATRNMTTDWMSGGPVKLSEALGSTAAKTASDINAPLIVVFTKTGSTVRMCAKYRPKATILAVCSDIQQAKAMQNIRGVITYTDAAMLKESVDWVADKAFNWLKSIGGESIGVFPGASCVMLSEGAAGQAIKVVKVP